MVKELQLSKKPWKKWFRNYKQAKNHRWKKVLGTSSKQKTIENGFGTSIEQKTIDKMVYELQLSKNHGINGLGTSSKQKDHRTII